MRQVARWTGRAVTLGALASWLAWLGWRMSELDGAVGVIVFAVELVAFSAAAVVTLGLWLAPISPRGRPARRGPVPVVMADVLGLADVAEISDDDRAQVGRDDTGEIAWARRGMDVIGGRRGDGMSEHRRSAVWCRELAWSVASVDGLRRMLFVAALVVVLFSGHAPFTRPPVAAVVALLAGVVGVSIGHWLMSVGRLRPGARTIWSMASIGAGVGDGVSRSGLPIRWATTMATVVALNLAVALRGLSDRWTHGLGAMRHDARVVSMSLAFGLVVVGLVSLRSLPRPDLGFYGATRRLEESSARRLALGGTIAVAVLGFVLGVLPTDGAS